MSDAQNFVTREELARTFHEAYERLAPNHGYSTRLESAVPWDDVRDPNRSLMLETMDAILAQFTVLHPTPVAVLPSKQMTLDPKPWICVTCSDRFVHEPEQGKPHYCDLAPRTGYSIDTADYSPKDTTNV